MTEERLQEIKDSIEFQKKIYEIKGYELGIVQEEIDLYNEVISLKEENERLKKELNKQIKEGIEKDLVINKAIEYCDREIKNIIANFDYVDTKDLENVRRILQGRDKDDGNI